MFGAPVSNGLSLTKVISGLSKTLSVANQVIPLYKEAKPMINNARSIISAFKSITSNNKEKTSTTSTNIVNNTPKNMSAKKERIIYNKVNSPRFFL